MSKVKENTIYAFEKGYVVTIDGNVLSPNGNMLTIIAGVKGYNRFTIRKEGIREGVLIHKLQAYQKYGLKSFDEKLVVRHLNGNSKDNSFSNIKIGTQSQNMMDRPKEERVKNASNPIHDHESIIKDRKQGMSYKAIMHKYNISSKGTVSFIINSSLKTK